MLTTLIPVAAAFPVEIATVSVTPAPVAAVAIFTLAPATEVLAKLTVETPAPLPIFTV